MSQVVAVRVVLMRGGDLTCVIAVISEQALDDVADVPVEQVKASGNVRVDVPAEQHLLVEPVDPEEIVPRR